MRAFHIILLAAVCAVTNAGYLGRTGYSGLGQSGYSGFSQSGYNGFEQSGQSRYYPGYHSGAVSTGYQAYPKYSFDYAVNDPHTGDHKTQWESRDGDVVRGAYSLAEPDGTTRIVEYTADKIHGFNAVVKRVGRAQHPQPARYNNPYKQAGYYTYH